MTNELEVQVGTPVVTVTRYQEEDLVIDWMDMDEDSEFNPGTISDTEMIEMVRRHLDLTDTSALRELVLGAGNTGELKVSRPETGNITIRPATVLGSPLPPPTLDPSFYTFVGVMASSTLLACILKLRSILFRGPRQQEKLDGYEAEAEHRGLVVPGKNNNWGSNATSRRPNESH